MYFLHDGKPKGLVRTIRGNCKLISMMKSVTPFVSRAAKKCKFSEDDKPTMAGPEERIREEAWKTRDDSHNQSLNSNQMCAELNATSSSLLSTLNCTTLGYNMTTLSDQTLEQDASTTDCHQRHENLEIDPSLQEPFFTSPSVVGRRWHSLRRRCYHRKRSENFEFTVISYNVLADGLLHSHSHLYVGVEHWMKEWEYRRRNLLQEILYYNADVICLQEVESGHYEEWFEPKLAKKGYAGIYMKRTGDKADGCATFFRNSRFTLVKSQLVSFRKPGVELMDRDNVAIVVLLEPKATNRSSRHSNNLICVSNTHLLFNMKRGDIKLAQLAWLFAEINEIARISPSEDGDGHHHPIICCGDFNSTPYSQIYNFVARGCLDYNGMFRENLSGQGHFHTYYSQPITRNIIPWELGIDSFCRKRNEDSSDFCIDSVDQQQVNLQPSASLENSAKTKDCFVQAAVSSQFHHLQSTCSRVQVDQLKDKEVESGIMSSESWELSTDSSVSVQRHAANFMSSSSKEYSITEEPSSSANSKDKFQDGEETSCELTVNSSERDLYDSCTFQRHAFHFYSVYRHTLRSGRPEVTTFHDRTCTTVDYMFVSPGIRQHCRRCRTLHGPLQLTGNLELLPEEDIRYLGGLPNRFLSSDHLSLFASFLLHL